MKLSRINNLLLVLILLINAYIILLPLLPAVSFGLRAHGDEEQRLASKIHTKPTASKPSTTDQTDRLIVPRMLLDEPILEGSINMQYRTLNNGIWRWPKGSTPDKGSNMVLIGHRFTYTNPQGVFYHLDRLRQDDEIGLFWHGKRYNYRVSSVREVSPTETSIENASDKSELTLFTCTPLWFPKHRLVVVAESEAQ